MTAKLGSGLADGSRQRARLFLLSDASALKRARAAAAAREADFDEHRAEVRSFGCGGHDHREYDYRG